MTAPDLRALARECCEKLAGYPFDDHSVRNPNCECVTLESYLRRAAESAAAEAVKERDALRERLEKLLPVETVIDSLTRSGEIMSAELSVRAAQITELREQRDAAEKALRGLNWRSRIRDGEPCFLIEGCRAGLGEHLQICEQARAVLKAADAREGGGA